MREWFNPGEPAVWLTLRVAPWKQQVAHAVQFGSAAPPAHLHLDLRASDATPADWDTLMSAPR